MVNERGKIGFASLNERQRHDARRLIRLRKKHGKAVHEIPNGGLYRLPTEICFCWEKSCLNPEFAAKEGELVGLRFQVGKLWVCEHEVENRNPGLDVFVFMPAPVAKVLPVEFAVNLAREEVIDPPVSRKCAAPRVFIGLELVPKQVRALAPLDARESEKLTSHEIAGVCGNDVEKTCLGLGIAEGLQCGDVYRVDVHREKILAVSSESSRMRRSFDASSRGA